MEKLTKYWQVFKVSLQESLVYRTNFVLWRVRTVMQLLVLYFFWSVVFLNQDQLFGYDKASILTYILGASIIRSFVLSSRSVDVAGEIHQGILTNFLLRPVSYIRYWLTRDLSDKVLNIVFTIAELSLIIYLLRPPLFIQTDSTTLALFVLATLLALGLYFYLSFIFSMIAFWSREAWAPRFLLLVVIEFLSGAVFPLDILPQPIFNLLQVLPFGYLIFFPLKIYLGQLSFASVLSGLALLGFWTVLTMQLVYYLWAKGLRVYQAEGR